MFINQLIVTAGLAGREG